MAVRRGRFVALVALACGVSAAILFACQRGASSGASSAPLALKGSDNAVAARADESVTAVLTELAEGEAVHDGEAEAIERAAAASGRATGTHGALAMMPAAVTSCPPESAGRETTLSEPGGPKKHFSLHGYVARTLRITRQPGSEARLRPLGAVELGAVEHAHCIEVAWPPGGVNSDGKAVRVAAGIDEAWFRAIENTLARVPWRHVTVLERIVIDNRPKKHGIAAHDRESTDDARDGRTIWLNEHLFRDPNHWERGNYGIYFAYHVSEDGRRIDGAPADHDLFSPVLLHELGHLVMYHVVNTGEDRLSAPPCAEICGDRDAGCKGLSKAEREAECLSPYCKPFGYETGTENFAEQYRFYYQSSTTRALLGAAGARCGVSLGEAEGLEYGAAPWERGLPDIASFQRSRWDSCGGRACRKW